MSGESDTSNKVQVKVSRVEEIEVNPLVKNPTVDRACPDVAPPHVKPLTDEEFYHDEKRELPNLKNIKDHFFHEGRLTSEQAIFLTTKASEVFRKEPTLLEISAPLTISGDIHGQFYDLLRLLDVGGDPSETTYLFLGDYVDRGYFGLECVFYLFALKIWYPNLLHMLRGNHECRHLTKHFTFRLECQYKYSNDVYKACADAFNTLPLAAVVNEQFFCVHGGFPQN
ncbi:3',5'-cyclic-nucleotide phosphodiesterase (PDEase) (3':5'-CNP) [Entomophthora muscae]|uniref:3',5'-cyclic-nucleotide phosphodiesterase (PDEase) (3':5'-CNP) n=2 Tax=Entomophthora muscae TaxID=34485 RepID=A0ACC2TNU8_9FUNG|nr:3',5'-cyclic-nucleotide phosphodiesterase (PDEase) (3':5'-CNP) [Entomophthora muscae]KAJ9083429.1 3',5'-cyclic-nucleotide phosphodiesterase (PDEase) (3':5'-CNP) [Entomophthora muscae]